MKGREERVFLKSKIYVKDCFMLYLFPAMFLIAQGCSSARHEFRKHPDSSVPFFVKENEKAFPDYAHEVNLGLDSSATLKDDLIDSTLRRRNWEEGDSKYLTHLRGASSIIFQESSEEAMIGLSEKPKRKESFQFFSATKPEENIEMNSNSRILIIIMGSVFLILLSLGIIKPFS